jgi:hypothetical protein
MDLSLEIDDDVLERNPQLRQSQNRSLASSKIVLSTGINIWRPQFSTHDKYQMDP